MKIEQFIAQSEGQWRSMRSGHSLAFQQFEQIVSKLDIKILEHHDPKVLALLTSKPNIVGKHVLPFSIEWEADSDWSEESPSTVNRGSSIFIPIPQSPTNGFILQSLGYTEPIETFSNYSFLDDDTFTLRTTYDKTTTEERIWFLSNNVRCRSSVVYLKKETGIIQTSFASEIRLSQNQKKQSTRNND